MAANDKAKELIMNKITAALSDCYLGTQDKKYYFNSKENGETKVVCLTITCPKTVPEFITVQEGDFNWEDELDARAITESVEIPQSEIDTVKAMLDKLGL